MTMMTLTTISRRFQPGRQSSSRRGEPLRNSMKRLRFNQCTQREKRIKSLLQFMQKCLVDLSCVCTRDSQSAKSAMRYSLGRYLSRVRDFINFIDTRNQFVKPVKRKITRYRVFRNLWFMIEEEKFCTLLRRYSLNEINNSILDTRMLLFVSMYDSLLMKYTG